MPPASTGTKVVVVVERAGWVGVVDFVPEAHPAVHRARRMATMSTMRRRIMPEV